MKKQIDRIRQYEAEKDKLKLTCTSCEEYERAVAVLARRLKV